MKPLSCILWAPFFCVVVAFFHPTPIRCEQILRENSNFTIGSYFEFIYIDANSGQSSGGHSAVRFKDIVYHFQLYPDGIFHIVREPWFDFRLGYNIYENRTLELIQIYPQKNPSNFWETGFNRLYLIQQKHLQNLKELYEDTLILESLMNPEKWFTVEGLGYIDWKSKRKQDEKHPESDFFSSEEWKRYSEVERNRLWHEIQNLNIESCTQFSERLQTLSSSIYPMGMRSISSEYLPRIQRLGLLEAVTENHDLDVEGLLTLPERIAPPPNRVELEAMHSLEMSLQKKLEESIYETKLYYAQNHLLVWNTIQILKKIRLEGKWSFLDTFTEKRQIVRWEQKSDLENLSNETILLFHKVRSVVFSASLDLQGFLDLQDAANRVMEIQRARDGLRPIRNIHGRTLPLRKGIPPSYPLIPVKRSPLQEVYEKRKKDAQNYKLSLQEIYPYHLILQNCTSEIFFSFDKIHNYDLDSIKSDLGKHIDPLSSLSFIPFYASYDIKKNYTKTKSYLLLSYRRASLEKLKINSTLPERIYIDLKESFVPFSTLYKKNSEDHSFLFFTDDTFFLRPIYGTGNLFYGAFVSVAGIFYYPWDKGKRFLSGIRGIFFSFPEILFFNINKGSFLHLTLKDLNPEFPNEYLEKPDDSRPFSERHN